MSQNPESPNPEPQNPRADAAPAEPILPHATEKTQADDPPPLYVSGWGVMGQSTPDVATGSTPVTRHDDI